MTPHVTQPPRHLIANQLAQNSASRRERPDQTAGLIIDPHGEESAERRAGLVPHPQRGISGASHLAGGMQDPLEHQLDIKLLSTLRAIVRIPRADSSIPTFCLGPPRRQPTR